MNKKVKKTLKKNKKRIFFGGIIILLVAVILGSLYFGFKSEEISKEENVLARVNGKDITQSEVNKIQQILISQGQQARSDVALEEAINKEIVIQEASKKYSVSDQEAEEILRGIVEQQGETIEDLKKQLSSQEVSYEDVLENLREQMLVQKYLQDEITVPNVSEEEAKEFYKNNKDKFGENVPAFEDVKEQIINILKQQKKLEEISKLIQDLRANANIEYL